MGMMQQPAGNGTRALCFGHPPDVDADVCAALVSPVRLAEQHLGTRFGDDYRTFHERIPAFAADAIDPLVMEAWIGDDGWIVKYARNDRGNLFTCRNSDLASALPDDTCAGIRMVWDRGPVVLVPYGHPSIPR